MHVTAVGEIHPVLAQAVWPNPVDAAAVVEGAERLSVAKFRPRRVRMPPEVVGRFVVVWNETSGASYVSACTMVPTIEPRVKL